MRRPAILLWNKSCPSMFPPAAMRRPKKRPREKQEKNMFRTISCMARLSPEAWICAAAGRSMAETDKTGETTGRAGCGHKPARLRAQVCPPKGTGVLPCGQRCAPKRKEEPHPVAWLRRTPPDGYALRRAFSA